MSESLTQKWLRQNVQSYLAKDKLYADIDILLQRYPTLRPKSDVYTFDDGRSQLLLCVHGLLPITYRQASYNIPVNVWITKEYPRHPPIAYVVPTSDMLVKSGRYLDVSGRCSHEYIQNWKRKDEGCSLLGLLQELQDQFSREPPVYAKPKRSAVSSSLDISQTNLPPPVPTRPPVPPASHLSQTATLSPPRPPRPPLQSHVESGSRPTFQPIPLTTSVPLQGTPSPHPAPPPPPPPLPPQLSDEVRHNGSYGPLRLASTIGQVTSDFSGATSYTLYQPPVSNPPQGLQGHNISPIPNIVAQPISAPPPPPVPLASAVQAFPSESRQNPVPNLIDDDDVDPSGGATFRISTQSVQTAPPRPPNPELLQLHRQVHEKLTSELNSLAQALALDAERLRAHQNDLLAGEPAIRDEMARLEAVRDVCRGVADRTRDAVQRAESNIAQLRRKGDPEVDELVCATSIVHNQLVNLVAEDNAIEDTIYHLHRALNCGRIDLERFLRSTRVLAEEQFTKRALINKILAGISPLSPSIGLE